ncbi:MAG: cation transporter [Pirellulaceae bacterium]|nr:cation transporter [Pirellulaceae bacterium]
MTHSHGHSHSHGDRQDGLRAAFLLNLGFTLLEIAGGLWTNSIAILADAVHDSGDCLSLGIAWYLQRVSRRESNARFTDGYQRFDIFGALITGVVLMLGIAFILWKAIPRVFSPEEVYSPGMMGLAVVGIAVTHGRPPSGCGGPQGVTL